MNMPDDRRSGVIVPFPLRGARRPPVRASFGPAPAPAPVVETCPSFGSWYHECAIAETDRTRKS